VRRGALKRPAMESIRLGVATLTWTLLTFGALTRPVLPQWGLIGLATMLPTLGQDWALATARNGWFARGGRALSTLAASATLAALGFLIWHAQGVSRFASTAPGRLLERSIDAAG